jgi:hypothetical protein
LSAERAVKQFPAWQRPVVVSSEQELTTGPPCQSLPQEAHPGDIGPSEVRATSRATSTHPNKNPRKGNFALRIPAKIPVSYIYSVFVNTRSMRLSYSFEDYVYILLVKLTYCERLGSSPFEYFRSKKFIFYILYHWSYSPVM